MDICSLPGTPSSLRIDVVLLVKHLGKDLLFDIASPPAIALLYIQGLSERGTCDACHRFSYTLYNVCTATCLHLAGEDPHLEHWGLLRDL